MNMAIYKKRLFTKAAGAVGHQSLRLDIFLLLAVSNVRKL